jgi:quercetin dioxygenase-like cupin family protein
MRKLQRGACNAKKLLYLAAALALIVPSAAFTQATARLCTAVEEAGPACLLARQELASLPAGEIFWHIDRFPSKEAAAAAAIATGVVAEAFGSTWLFTLEKKAWQGKGGHHVAVIGPLVTPTAPSYAAEYLRSIFPPGTMAPLHVHSGPEAFYAVDGDTCLETPDSIKVGRGPGNSLLISAGPPMLLMAIGKVPRQGFALILHDSNLPPTTLTHSWYPQGLCARRFADDRGKR